VTIHALALQEQEATVDAGQFAQERAAVRKAWANCVESSQ
jgi:hypothetical protein